ncbi:MAG: hypothetical protein M1830_008238 [Pleopsidium flavum]|nr:MAG: hypothetical protein M1830_008238 [Pleopsidium flavum]
MDAVHSYTPVRRRRQSQYGETSPANAQVPWTTARCNRLLRPIASRLLLLRKSNAAKPTTPTPGTLAATQSSGPIPTPEEPVGSHEPFPARHRSGQRTTNGDPEWVPSPALRRRVKHKYSSRISGSRIERSSGRGINLPSTLPGEVTITTPVITQRTRQYFTASQDIEGTRLQDGIWDPGHYETVGRKRRKLQKCPTWSCAGNSMSQEMRQRLKKTVAPAHWMLVDGLYNGLDALLKATARSSRSDGCGVRSLFSTCLRKVPDYITAEKAWQESQDADDTTDVSSEVYTDLEDMGSIGKEGWKPLREVVRAHGVAMLGDAIRESLIDDVVGRGLIILCVQVSAFTEAETLLACLFSSLATIPRPLSVNSRLFAGDQTACLGTLDLFASRSGRRGFQYRQVEILLRVGILPIEWMATTELAPTWGRVVQSVSQVDQDFTDAAQLLITGATLACGSRHPSASNSIHKFRLATSKADLTITPRPSLPDVVGLIRSLGADGGLTAALNNTVSSLMAILSAISMSQGGQSDSAPEPRPLDSNKSALGLLWRLTVDILAGFELVTTCRRIHTMSKVDRQRTLTVMLAHFLLQKSLQRHQEEMPVSRLMNTLDIVAALTDLGAHAASEAASQMATFICSIARCCARVSPGQDFQYIQKHVQQLAFVASDEAMSTAARSLFARITSTTAFEYAEQTGNAKHLQWALDVEEDVREQSQCLIRSPKKTPLRAETAHSQGYRWEEGLCEWIAKTPAIPLEKQKPLEEPSESSIPDGVDFDSDSRHDAPFISIPFRLSESSPTKSEEKIQAAPRRGLSAAISAQERQYSGHTSATQHAKTIGEVGYERMEPRKRVRGRSMCRGIVAGEAKGPWKLHADTNEDELSTVALSGEHVNFQKRELIEMTNLVPTRKRRRESSGQVRRPAKSQPFRHQQGLWQHKAASLSYEDDSEDELGI